MSEYGDLRDQMHPGVAKTVPNTPEATAILHRNYFKPTTFGGFVTKLVETGAVEIGSMDEVRAAVCAMLDIESAEFDERLADQDTIDVRTADEWSTEYERRAKAELIEAATGENVGHLNDIMDRADGRDASILEKMISEQRAWIEAAQERVQERQAQGQMAMTIRDQIKLDRILLPALRELEASNYAIRVSELMELLRADAWFNSHGEEFSINVIGNFQAFSDYVKDAAIQEHDLQDIFTGECEDEWVLEIAQKTWLPESEIRLLAKTYAESFYGRLSGGDEVPGKQELDSIANPISDIFFVTEEEKAAFFVAFPLANGQLPK